MSRRKKSVRTPSVARKRMPFSRPKIYLTIGLPGCGKSSFWASDWVQSKKPVPVLLSSDKKRKELYGSEQDQTDAAAVFGLLKYEIKTYLSKGHSVYVDATHIKKWWRVFLFEIAEQYHAEVHGIVFQTPLWSCVKRDRKRSRTVGFKVLLRYWAMFEEPTFQEPFDTLTYVDKHGQVIETVQKS